METTAPKKFIVIELNVISAQQLQLNHNKTRMKTYVAASINPKQILTTRIDTLGDSSPTWNDKFIFGVDPERVTPSSTMVFKIYSVRPFWKDKRIGTVNVLIESLIGGSKGSGTAKIGGESMAFHVRRSDGEPQGILNIGVCRVDGLFHGKLHRVLGSGFGVDYRKLMGQNLGKENMKVCKGTGELQQEGMKVCKGGDVQKEDVKLCRVIGGLQSPPNDHSLGWLLQLELTTDRCSDLKV